MDKQFDRRIKIGLKKQPSYSKLGILWITLYKYTLPLKLIFLFVRVSNFDCCSLLRTTEKQDITIYVFEFEAAQTIVTIFAVFDGFKKLDITRQEFCCQCIGIWNM